MQLQGIKKLIKFPGYKVTGIIKFTDQELHLKIEPHKKKKSICGHCKGVGHHYHSQNTIKVEDLSCFGRRVFIYITKRYYHCPVDQRIHVEQVEGLEPWARVTKRFAHRVSQLTAITTNTEAAWFLGLDDEKVYRIDKAALEAQAKEKLEPITTGIHLSIDEVSYQKYHKYLTNVVDTIRKLVIWNAKGRKAETLDQYYQGIGPENCQNIVSVAMDGARTFLSSTTKYAINALIVYDRFHLSQKLNNTVDTVRKMELQKARINKEQPLIDMLSCKQRFILLKNSQNRTDRQEDALAKLCKVNQPIYEAMLLKDSFLGIYALNASEDEIKQYLLTWLDQAASSSLKPFQELSIKLRDKMNYILNWFKQRVSSAISEGINNKIKRLKRMAYGYKDIDYFRLKIHQHCGLLNPRLKPS